MVLRDLPIPANQGVLQQVHDLLVAFELVGVDPLLSVMRVDQRQAIAKVVREGALYISEANADAAHETGWQCSRRTDSIRAKALEHWHINLRRFRAKAPAHGRRQGHRRHDSKKAALQRR